MAPTSAGRRTVTGGPRRRRATRSWSCRSACWSATATPWTAQRSRLEAQLRTVVAPREAEALMHELETIAPAVTSSTTRSWPTSRSSRSWPTRCRLDAELPELEASAAAAAALPAEASITEELATLAAGRAELVARLDSTLLQRYERLRERLGGVAVARLEGARCGGCHLDLSTSELGEVKAVGPGEFAECPQCGRLLVP